MSRAARPPQARWWIAVALALSVAAALSLFREDVRPSVLLVSIDTLRADVAARAMPRLAGLSERGTVFTRATSVTPLTLPAHASLLTGCRPAAHGLTVNGLAVPELPSSTLAEELALAGYATGAFVSAAVLDRRHGLDRGFDTYVDDLHTPDGPPRPHELRGDVTVQRALDWIGRQSDPFLAFVHLYDPHAPYAAPGGRLAPREAAYEDEVSWTDELLGRLLDGVGDRDLLVVVTSDHGEGLGEHGEQTHGLLLHEATLHVPLVMAWTGADRPRSPPGGRAERSDVVSLLDVTPTVLELVDVPDSGARQRGGRSVIRAGEPRAIPLEARAGWFYYGFSPLAGVRLGEDKLVGAPEADPADWRRYSLVSDPRELAPVAGAQDPLRELVPETAPTIQAAPNADAATLRALGYAGAAAPPERDGARDDPRRAMALIDAIDAANTALVEGRPVDALAALAPHRQRWADVAELQLYIGKAERALGRLGAADAALARAVELQPAAVGTLHEHVKVLLQRADRGEVEPARALELLRRAEALVPGDRETIALWSLHDVIFGDPREALRRLEPALERWPDSQALLTVQRRARAALGEDG